MQVNRNKKVIIFFFLVIFTIGGFINHMRYQNIRNICYQIEKGNTEKAIELIEKTKDVNLYTFPFIFDKFYSIIDYDGLTNPLIVATENGNIEVVNKLLQKGADPNTHIKGHWTPIEVLYTRKHGNRYEIARLLIYHGADVNLVASNNYPIISVLRRINDESYSSEEVISNLQLLIENGSILIDHSDNNILMLASSSNKTEVVEYLIETNQFNIDHVNKKGKSALIIAAENNKIEVVKLLLNNGADKEIKDNTGKTTLDYAIENNSQELIDLLSK